MSSQASSAGHGEKEVRRKIVETGDVDVMISIRSNFFYTRTVPCELWHFDRAKPAERRDKVLMLDARNVYRKVTRKIYDFSPEQMQNLAAIVWLYRGPAGAVPRAGEGLPRPRLRRERGGPRGRSRPSRPRSRTCADASMRSPRRWRSTPTSTPARSRRSPMP